MRAISCSCCGASEFVLNSGLYTCAYCGTHYVFEGKEAYICGHKGDRLTLVGVRFPRSYKIYDYIYDLEEPVHRGDSVTVKGFRGDIDVEVVSVKQTSIAELPMPYGCYKSVLGKVEYRVY